MAAAHSVYVVDRLAGLRRHLDHLAELRPRVTGAEALRRDLSLHNDALHSLLTVCRHLTDLAAELACRRGLRFEDFSDAVRRLTVYPEISERLVRELEPFAPLRNTLTYECVTLDLERVLPTLDGLAPLEEFAEAVRRIEAAEP